MGHREKTKPKNNRSKEREELQLKCTENIFNKIREKKLYQSKEGVLSDHHGVKLEFNNNATFRKPTNHGN